MRVIVNGALEVCGFRIPVNYDQESESYEVLLSEEKSHTEDILRELHALCQDVEVDDSLFTGILIVNFAPFKEVPKLRAYLNKNYEVRMGQSPQSGDTEIPGYVALREKLDDIGYIKSELRCYGKTSFGLFVAEPFHSAKLHSSLIASNNIKVKGYSFTDSKIVFLITFTG